MTTSRNSIDFAGSNLEFKIMAHTPLYTFLTFHFLRIENLTQIQMPIKYKVIYE